MRTDLAQRVQDEQGYLIALSTKPLAIGTVIPGLTISVLPDGPIGFDLLDVPGPLVVIGPATSAEFMAQNERYREHFPGEPPDPSRLFYKLKAE